MKVKTSELVGHALDRAVNLIEEDCDDPCTPPFSSNWWFGGPIIEREKIAIWPDQESDGYFASADEGVGEDYTGPTPLIAAMRCFVASKLGDEVELPKELK